MFMFLRNENVQNYLSIIFIILINERTYILFYSYNHISKKVKNKNLIKDVNVTQLSNRRNDLILTTHLALYDCAIPTFH